MSAWARPTFFLGNTELSVTSYTRAYQLRDRLTEKDRLDATSPITVM